MTILNTTHYNKIPPFLEYTQKGPLPKQYANMFNHFIKAETLKSKIVFKITTSHKTFILKVSPISKQHLHTILTNPSKMPTHLSVLFDINSLQNKYISHWLTPPIIYTDIEIHPFKYTEKPVKKLLYTIEWGENTLESLIHTKPYKFTSAETIRCITQVWNGILALQTRKILHLDLKIDNIVYLKHYRLIDFDEADYVQRLKNKQIQNHYSERILDIPDFKKVFNSNIEPTKLTIANSSYLFDLYFFLATFYIKASTFFSQSAQDTLLQLIQLLDNRLTEYREITPAEVIHLYNQFKHRQFTSSRTPIRRKTLRKTRTLSPNYKYTRRTRKSPTHKSPTRTRTRTHKSPTRTSTRTYKSPTRTHKSTTHSKKFNTI